MGDKFPKGSFRQLDGFKIRIECVIEHLYPIASEMSGNREIALAIERLLEGAFWLKQARGRALHELISSGEIKAVEDEGNILNEQQEAKASEELAGTGMFVFKSSAKIEADNG